MNPSSQPPVTVVVPVYNVAPYLEECLDSVLAQSLPGLEVIVVDDKSDDGSRELLRPYENRPGVQVIYLERRSGVSAARNVGLRLATGRYVGFVDGDDVATPTMFAHLHGAASVQDADIAVCGYRRFSERGSLVVEMPALPSGRKIARSELQRALDRSHRDRLIHFSCRHLFRKSLLDSTGIRFPTDLRLGEDTVFNLMALNAADSLVTVPEPLYLVRTRPHSATTQRHREDMLAQLQRQYEIIAAHYRSRGLQARLADDYGQYVLTNLLPMLFGNAVGSNGGLSQLGRDLRKIARTPFFQDAVSSRPLAQRSLSPQALATTWLLQHGHTKLVATAYWAVTRAQRFGRRGA